MIDRYPLEVRLDFTHNHSINSANAMKYRPVSEDCKAKFMELFQKDFTPSGAFAWYKKDLQAGKTDLEILHLMADRSIMPDYLWVFHQHKSYIESTYGPETGPEAFKLAKEKISSYNKKHGVELAKIEISENGDVIAAICDKFCQRVHESVSQEILY